MRGARRASAPGPISSRAASAPTRPAVVHDAMVETVDEVGRVCLDEGIDAEYQRDGELLVAIGDHQLPALDAIERTYARIGRDQFHRRLSADETHQRIDIDGRAARCSIPRPLRCTRAGSCGSRGALERRGGVIHESTRGPRRSGAARSPISTLQRAGARTRDRPRGRGLSLAVAGTASRGAADLLVHRAHRTAPARAARHDQLDASNGGQLPGAHRRLPLAHGRRPDSLRGTGLAVSLRVGDHVCIRPRRADDLRACADRSSSGSRASAGFSARTRGAAASACPATSCRSCATTAGRAVATARGYTGEGVAASNLSGRVLADLITGTDSRSLRSR